MEASDFRCSICYELLLDPVVGELPSSGGGPGRCARGQKRDPRPPTSRACGCRD
jgi:hypothetical protein